MEIVLLTFTQLLSESPGAGRVPMTGTLDELREDARRLRDMGISHLIQSPGIAFEPRSSIDDMLAVMEQLIKV
jgi:hypothetical protein